MPRYLLIALIAASTCHSALHADNLQLTLDLKNTFRNNATSGGTWQLFARVVETGDGVEGAGGIAGIRALIDRIDVAGVTFNPAINPNGIATVQAVPSDAEGTIEIIYRQDLTQPTLSGVGVPPANFPNRDVLIASGSWPPGLLRPLFGNEDGAASSGEFLADGGTATVSAENVPTSIFTIGDMNRSNTVTSLDTIHYVLQLPGNPTPRPYDPAGDINQSGHVSNLDTAGLIAIYSGPVYSGPVGLSAPVSVVPEPASIIVAVIILGAACQSRGLVKETVL